MSHLPTKLFGISTIRPREFPFVIVDFLVSEGWRLSKSDKKWTKDNCISNSIGYVYEIDANTIRGFFNHGVDDGDEEEKKIEFEEKFNGLESFKVAYSLFVEFFYKNFG